MGSSSLNRTYELGELNRILRLFTPRGELVQLVIIFSSIGHLTRGVNVDYTVSLGLLLILLCFLLHIFSCENYFLLVFSLFSLMLIL